MIGRADIEGSKSNVAMNAWLPQASYPCDVPPQPNSPPDNVFRPDRPAEAGLGSKKRGIAPLPIHGISKNNVKSSGISLSPEGSHLYYTSQVISQSRTRVKLNRVFFPADSAKPVPLAVVSLDSRQGQPPKEPFPVRPPAGHAATRSRRGSSSKQSADSRRVRDWDPRAQPSEPILSRGYGSILPTSLAYIVPSTRGCSPWRPDAVMSTTGRGRALGPPDFQWAAGGRTGHRATCGALPAAGPYLRLSRFQGGQAVKQKR
ncbi:hypothetical protein L1887_56366 [Cichorium endivia]|nr:hypothetical protein L1887_56366 [Cichorium endivia]